MSSLSGLREEVGGLTGDLAVLDTRELADRLQELERLVRTLEHTVVSVVAEADRRQVWAEDGHRSVRGWCMATTNWSWGETTARLRTVPLLPDLPACDAALASGAVGVAQVRELARARANPRCGDQLAEVEELLVEHATGLPFDDFRRVVQRWEALADVDGAHRDHESAHEQRHAEADLLGPEFHLTAHGGAAQGAAIEEIFDRFADAEFHADWDECKARYGDDATPTCSPAAPGSAASTPSTRSSWPPRRPRPAPRRRNRWSASSSTTPRSKPPSPPSCATSRRYPRRRRRRIR